jgi:hypothetical protein
MTAVDDMRRNYWETYEKVGEPQLRPNLTEYDVWEDGAGFIYDFRNGDSFGPYGKSLILDTPPELPMIPMRRRERPELAPTLEERLARVEGTLDRLRIELRRLGGTDGDVDLLKDVIKGALGDKS